MEASRKVGGGRWEVGGDDDDDDDEAQEAISVSWRGCVHNSAYVKD